MIETISLACDCCRSSNTSLILEKRGEISGQLFRLVRCSGCGFLYFNPRPTERAIEKLYDSAYYSGAGFDANVDYTHGKDVQEKKELAKECMRFKPAGSKILDYGCGLGGFAKAAAAVGYLVEGYEPSGAGRAACEEFGLFVYDSPVSIPNDSFDVVVAIEVIEHAFKPSELFRHIHRVLKPDGIFLYTTWNPTAWLVQRRFGLSQDHGYIVPEGHLNFFSRPVMKKYLKQAGFSRITKPFWSPVRTPHELAKHILKTGLNVHLPSAMK